MKHNVPIIPCYIFGVSDYHYTNNQWLFGPRRWIQKRFGVALPFAIGYWGSMCPLPVKTTVVVGAPLRFAEITSPGDGGDGGGGSSPKQPTQKEIDFAHQQFCLALSDLFDQHKTRLGYGDRQLEIV